MATGGGRIDCGAGGAALSGTRAAAWEQLEHGELAKQLGQHTEPR
jgi:hypothetical protein